MPEPLVQTAVDQAQGRIDALLRAIEEGRRPLALNAVRSEIDDAFLSLRNALSLEPKTAGPAPRRTFDPACEIDDEEASELDPTTLRMVEQCRMLDLAQVPNGDKAIDQFLHHHWTAEHVARHGPHDKPRTIRSWRSTRGSVGNRHPRHMVRGNRVPRGPRPRTASHAFMDDRAALVLAGEANASEMHRRYAAEVDQINLGTHPTVARPDQPLRKFPARTFHRAVCKARAAQLKDSS